MFVRNTTKPGSDLMTNTTKGVVMINANRNGSPVNFKELNVTIREAMRNGAKRIVLENVTGQRYIAATASRKDLYMEIHGTPGNDLCAFLDGPTVEVFGNAQDMMGNTMNSGKIIVHGNAWDVTGLAARGGMMFIKGNSGYRVGIHMKEYGAMRPTLVIGGTAKDYLGEYMAGGTLLVLGLGHESDPSPIGINIGAGIHGGRIFVRGKVSNEQLGPGAVISDMTDEDKAEVDSLISEFDSYFKLDVKRDWKNFTKIVPASSRPFQGKYDKTNI
jgi:glutamate synthase domain-containing protein 3